MEWAHAMRAAATQPKTLCVPDSASAGKVRGHPQSLQLDVWQSMQSIHLNLPLPGLALTLITAMAPVYVWAANSGAMIPIKSHERASATVPISKSVPASVGTTQAPDTDETHYRTLLGTHFSYRCHIPYTLPSKDAAVEVCEIDPVTLQILSWPETEVIQLIKGEVTITEPNGQSSHYTAGDIFVLPKGFKGVWRQSHKLQKVVVRQPLYWKD